jgi:hypothetical protein
LRRPLPLPDQPPLGQDSVNWTAVGRIALGTFATAALMAAVKYLKAQRDTPLAEPLTAVLTGAAEQIAARTGLNDVKLGVALPTLSVAQSTDTVSHQTVGEWLSAPVTAQVA